MNAMKKNDTKKANTGANAPAVANCTRTSNFAAHRDGRSEKRITTHLPLLLYIPLVLVLVLKNTRNALLDLSGKIASGISSGIENLLSSLNITLNVNINPTVVLVILVAIIALLILIWHRILVGRELERCNKAEQTRYYFYDDIIEFCTKEKRESFRTVNGIVSVKVTPAVNKGFGPSFMTVLIALLAFNSKPLWQRRYGFRDVTIVTLGSPSETIVLHDVEDPATLVNNIKLHYPQCNVESFGNGFNL